jgi:hypothetical protein
MLLVLLSGPPVTPDLAMAVAGAIELAPTEVRWKLAGIMPRVLLSDADGDRLAALIDPLAALGISAVMCDAKMAEGDRERFIARDLDFTDSGLQARQADGTVTVCPYTSMDLIQRGARDQNERTVTQETSRKLNVGKAMLGLGLTSKHKKDVVRHRYQSERFILIQRNDGDPDLILYEHRLNYEFLGAQKQPASFANLDAVFRLLRTHAPQVPVDLTLVAKGFFNGMPELGTDKVDLGLFLVRLKHRVTGS